MNIRIKFTKLLSFCFSLWLTVNFFIYPTTVSAAPVNTDYLFGGDVTNVQKLSEQSGLGLQDPRETIDLLIKD